MNRLVEMEVFACVVETGSFSAAGRVLKLGQPAISKTIAQLERRLGVQLLIRSTHGLATTEAGQEYFERARLVIESADEADRAARGAATKLSGRLRISAAVTFARLHVLPFLGAFLEQHPALEIDVLLDDRNIELISAGVDVALRMGTLADSALTVRKLGQSPRRVIASPEYLDRVGEPQLPGDLTEHQIIAYERRGGGVSWTFRRGLEEIPVKLKGRISVNAAEGVREAVFAGFGMAVASEWMFASELRSGAVRAVLRDWSLPPLDLWAVFPTGRRASIKARTFAHFIEQRLSGESTIVHEAP